MLLSDDQSQFAPSVAFRKYKQEISEYASLSDNETRILFQKLAHTTKATDKKKIKEQIYQAYLSYVIDIAETFTDIELILVDFIQEGNIVLWEALETYNYADKTSFLEYITPGIQEALELYMEENPLPTNLPINITPIKPEKVTKKKKQ